MKRFTYLTVLAGILLLSATACSTFPGPGPYDAPPPPGYDDPPRYDTPPPAYNSVDQRIHDRVHRALDRAPALDDARIGVRVENRNVYLSGTVYSYNQRKVAHEVAHSVDGVRRVFTRDIRVYH